MGEIRFVGTGETRGYPYLVCKKKKSILHILYLPFHKYYLTYSADLNNTPQNATSDHGLHYMFLHETIVYLFIFFYLFIYFPLK